MAFCCERSLTRRAKPTRTHSNRIHLNILIIFWRPTILLFVSAVSLLKSHSALPPAARKSTPDDTETGNSNTNNIIERDELRSVYIISDCVCFLHIDLLTEKIHIHPRVRLYQKLSIGRLSEKVQHLMDDKSKEISNSLQSKHVIGLVLSFV